MINDGSLNSIDFSNIEKKLKNSLRPIKADPQFISQLQSRLSRRSDITLDTRNKGMVLIILAVGLIIGGLFYLLFRKVI